MNMAPRRRRHRHLLPDTSRSLFLRQLIVEAPKIMRVLSTYGAMGSGCRRENLTRAKRGSSSDPATPRTGAAPPAERQPVARALSLASFKLLLALSRQDRSMREVSASCTSRPRTVTDIIDGLQPRDLVVRRAHPSDRRITLLRASPELAPAGLARPRAADRARTGHRMGWTRTSGATRAGCWRGRRGANAAVPGVSGDPGNPAELAERAELVVWPACERDSCWAVGGGS